MQPTPTDPELPATDLLRETVAEARDLVRIEVALARDELVRELKSLKLCALLAAAAGVSAVLGVALLLVGVCLMLGPAGAIIVTTGLFVVAACAGGAAYARAPKAPMVTTIDRIRAGEHLVKDRLS